MSSFSTVNVYSGLRNNAILGFQLEKYFFLTGFLEKSSWPPENSTRQSFCCLFQFVNFVCALAVMATVAMSSIIMIFFIIICFLELVNESIPAVVDIRLVPFV